MPAKVESMNTEVPTYITIINKVMAVRAFTICPIISDLNVRRAGGIFYFLCNCSTINKPAPATMVYELKMTKLSHPKKNVIK